jgi:hypothetical protein
MRIIASTVAFALAGFSAPTASACRVAPEPVFVPIWGSAPTADQLNPGEVALEVEVAGYGRPSGSNDPDIVVLGCQGFQDIFRVVHVIAGDARGAGYVIAPGTAELVAAIVVDERGAETMPPPPRMFVVGHLKPQSEYFIRGQGLENTGIPLMKPGFDLLDRAIPVLDPRTPP